MSSKLRNRVVYYTTPNGKMPVKDFIDSLADTQKTKVFNTFQLYQESGLIGLIPHTKHLTGTPLWEIRIVGKDSVRILYVSRTKNSILALHGFIKKKQKTPTKEIKTALERLKKWKIVYGP